MKFDDLIDQFVASKNRPISEIYPDKRVPKGIDPAKAGINLPARWRQLLDSQNGAWIIGTNENGSCEILIYPSGLISAQTQSDRETAKSNGRKLNVQWITVGSNVNDSESIALDTSTLTPNGDCAVLQLSHHSYEPNNRWNCIAEFLEFVVGIKSSLDDEPSAESSDAFLGIAIRIATELKNGKSYGQIEKSLLEDGRDFTEIMIAGMVVRNGLQAIIEIRDGRKRDVVIREFDESSANGIGRKLLEKMIEIYGSAPVDKILNALNEAISS